MFEYSAIEMAWVAIVGACFGSLITLLSYRLPRNLPVGVERSRCPSCKTVLGVRDLVPVLSFLYNRAVCRHCKVKLSWRYVWIELVTAAVCVLLWWQLGVSWQFAWLAGLSVCLITLIVTDLEHYFIPDVVQIAMAVLGGLYIWQMQFSWDEHLIAALVGGAVGAGLRYGFRWLRKKDGLGLGDVKLLAVAGLWLGVMPLAPFFMLAGVVGVALAMVWRLLGRGAVFPFGPALAVSLWVCLLFPEVVDGYYGWLK